MQAPKKRHDTHTLTDDNLLQLEAGMQPHAQHHSVLEGKELLLGPLKPQRGHKLEGAYWQRGSLSFPRILNL